ncbi:unnamed protein product [Coregonus sp. 'balchen']|nr:unnamed protein product [Coregonus sp. 'balchen']
MFPPSLCIMSCSFPTNSGMAAPDLLDPKSATHNSKPCLSAKSITLSPREECQAIATVMKWKTVSAIFLLVVLYLVVGAAVFRALEQPHESAQRLAILNQKLEFLSTHTCVNHSQLEELVKVPLLLCGCAHVHLEGFPFLFKAEHSLSSLSLYTFCTFVQTCFGNISPHTEGGRIFCIIYALLGIPLFGFLLAGQWDVSQTKIRVISTVLFILFGCLLFVALPAAIFKHIEVWSALESLYFVVITLTTIGFGDFVAGGSEIEYLDYYKPVVWFWILVGLAYFAAVLSMIGDWLRVISKKTKEEVGEIRAHAAEWTANVSAEFKETRRRLSVEVYDKFQRAASIKRKLSTDLGLNSTPELTPPKRMLSVNFTDERDRERETMFPHMTKNGSIFPNGLGAEPRRGDVAIIEHLK